jgi:hypothetical protein
MMSPKRMPREPGFVLLKICKRRPVLDDRSRDPGQQDLGVRKILGHEEGFRLRADSPAASRANRSALSRSRLSSKAFCVFAYSVSVVSDWAGLNNLLASVTARLGGGRFDISVSDFRSPHCFPRDDCRGLCSGEGLRALPVREGGAGYGFQGCLLAPSVDLKEANGIRCNWFQAHVACGILDRHYFGTAFLRFDALGEGAG